MMEYLHCITDVILAISQETQWEVFLVMYERSQKRTPKPSCLKEFSYIR